MVLNGINGRGDAVVEYGVAPRQLGEVGIPQQPRDLGTLLEGRTAALHPSAGHPYGAAHRSSLPDAVPCCGWRSLGRPPRPRTRCVLGVHSEATTDGMHARDRLA